MIIHFYQVPALVKSVVAWVLADVDTWFIACLGNIQHHIGVGILNIAAPIDEIVIVNQM